MKDRINAASLLIDGAVFHRADRVAVVADESHVTYAALSRLSNRIANVLVSLGCVPGCQALLTLPDSVDLIAAILAVVKIGAVAVPVAPDATKDDYRALLAESGAKFLVAGPASPNAVLAARATRTVRILATREQSTSRRAQRWSSAIRSASSRLEPHLDAPDAPAVLLYTSGSTGRHKGVVHSHGAMMAAVKNVGRATFGIRGTDRVLSTARLPFAFGFGFGMLLPLGAQATTVLHPTKDLKTLARLVADERATIVCGVPSLLDVVLRASATWLGFDASSLRFVVSAGEPLPNVVYDGYRDRFGVEVLDGIGCTETLTHFIANRPGCSRRGSCGTPVPGCEVHLVDDGGGPAADGEIGSLLVQSETRFLGYCGPLETTTQAGSERRIATGDTLYRDRDGFYHYCGRNDDMLKISGMWVSSREVESVLCAHPDVERCAVTIREDPLGRRRLVAYVMARVAARRSPSFYEYAAEHLPSHMIPAVFVPMSIFPLTPNGKLKRSAFPEPKWASC